MLNDYTLPWHFMPAMCVNLHTFTETTALRPKKLIAIYQRSLYISIWYIYLYKMSLYMRILYKFYKYYFNYYIKVVFFTTQ